jgi:predicted nucleotidyltransferase
MENIIMITEQEKGIIIDCAKKYNIKKVILFGSAIRKDKDYNDIDIGIKGITSNLFFKFYGELFKELTKNIDIIDLSQKSKFNDLVEETGISIYG